MPSESAEIVVARQVSRSHVEPVERVRTHGNLRTPGDNFNSLCLSPSDRLLLTRALAPRSPVLLVAKGVT